jgi:hypothetical protein
MSKRVLQVPQLANGCRFGNQMQWYAIAKWFSETFKAEIQTPPWHGERIFSINDPDHENSFHRKLISWPMAEDMKTWDGCGVLNSQEYVFLPQYTLADFRRYMPLRPEYAHSEASFPAVAHVRRGDFAQQPNMWPYVTDRQILIAAKELGYGQVELISEETPHRNLQHPFRFPWLEDFLIMCTAPVLFVYPSSSFSSCAGMFNRHKVYLPTGYHNGPTECRWELRKEP